MHCPPHTHTHTHTHNYRRLTGLRRDGDRKSVRVAAAEAEHRDGIGGARWVEGGSVPPAAAALQSGDDVFISAALSQCTCTCTCTCVYCRPSICGDEVMLVIEGRGDTDKYVCFLALLPYIHCSNSLATPPKA